MLGLPQTTEVKKIIPKRALYSKFQMNTAEQKEFDAAIRQMTIVNEISLRTIPALQKQEQEKQFCFGGTAEAGGLCGKAFAKAVQAD